MGDVSLMLVHGPRVASASSGGGPPPRHTPDGYPHPTWRRVVGRGAHKTTLPALHDTDWNRRAELYTEICQTQALYAGFASRTAMNHRLLKHVPISFIRDIFVELSNATGFGAGEFREDELAAVAHDKVGCCDGREFFLERLVILIVHSTGDEQWGRDMAPRKVMTNVILRHHLLRELYRSASAYTLAVRGAH
mmetsp:Transcript_77809/g.170395  ORF Transcript_77809/g.170395 Transcript_77809/m.170395 type:complete len:193 (-) Transcript_77809:265-843(-)